MDTRDLFAAFAMHAWLIEDIKNDSPDSTGVDPQAVAESAYVYADAMMQARGPEKNPWE